MVETISRETIRDPWQHRSEHMKCRSCMAYAPKTDNVGRCRKRSPTMHGYPVVFPDDDWCMKHKIDEVYIEHKKGREEEEEKLDGLLRNTIDR